MEEKELNINETVVKSSGQITVCADTEQRHFERFCGWLKSDRPFKRAVPIVSKKY